MPQIDEFYKNASVQSRLIEYLGGSSLNDMSCVYITRCDVPFSPRNVREAKDLEYLLVNAVDIGRSLWDGRSLIVHLDIEYVNFDFPAEPYIDSLRCFERQQPVVLSVEKLLMRYGIKPLHLLTGRGHHFIWKISRGSKPFHMLAALGKITDTLKQYYRSRRMPLNDGVSCELGAAFSGLGMVIEYIAYRIQHKAFPDSRCPLTLTEVYVGPVDRGREIISIDISEYGDPLDTRVVRIPFTLYRKPWEKGIATSTEIRDSVQHLIVIPMQEIDIYKAIGIRQDLQQVISLAQRASVCIPEYNQETERLIRDYETSPVRHFHEWFYEQEHDPPHTWAETYDRIDLTMLPPCIRMLLKNPNDLLLKPGGIQQLVRTLLALGWHPRHIAGLIRSKYERDYSWGNQWYIYDAATRADFYTRIFTGSFVAADDQLVDFNCLSAKEKGLCFYPESGCDLEQFKKSLHERQTHERLGACPFNRLFFS